MVSIGKYGYVNAKVRAMRSYLISSALYQNLMDAKDWHELQSLISQTHFKDCLEKIDIQDESEIERALFWDEIQRLRTIQKSCRGNLGKILALFIERYDLDRLKIILRVWYSKGRYSDQIIEGKITYDFPVDRILGAQELKEIINVLTLTPFAKVLESVSSDFTQKQSPFPLELALDKDYFSRLMKEGESLNKRDCRIFNRLIGLEIDLKNLDWIGRYKTYYQMSSADIGLQLLPYGYRLEPEEIREIVGNENLVEALFHSIEKVRKGKLGNWEGGVALESLEKFLVHILYSEAQHAFAEFPFSIGSILGYFYLMRIESKNVRTLIQAKAYDMPIEEINQLLVY